MRRATFLIALSATLAACSSNPVEPPVPTDPTDAMSVVEAARQCDVADFADIPVVEIGQPEFHGDPGTAERNQLESDIYLERMSFQHCVYELPSGLLLRVIRASDEDTGTPTPGEMVTAHYEGSFANGEVFDSSFDRGAPITHSSTGFIAGWNEALSLMRVGEEWELFIPSNLAYGERGVGPIGPNTALKFRMELICLPAREDAVCDAPAESQD